MRQIGALEYSVKGAKKLAAMWGAMMLMNAVMIALYVLLAHGTWQIGYHILLLALSAWLFRRYSIKLADARRREEKAEWERAMFIEWSR